MNDDVRRTMNRRTMLTSSVMGATGLALASVGVERIAAQEGTPEASPVGVVNDEEATVAADASPAAVTASQYAYVGIDSRSAIGAGADAAMAGITVFAIDSESGALQEIQSLPSDNAFFFAFDADQTHLYAVNVIGDYEGGSNGSVEAYARDPETGMLTFLNRVDSGGAVSAQPAVSPSGRWLLVANYGGGNVTVLRINDDGSVGEVVGGVERMRATPEAAPQDQSRPHAAVFDPAGNFVAVADLGTDHVLTYSLDDATGELTEVSSVDAQPGSGPRHIVFNVDGTVMYVVNELGGTIDVYAYDMTTGAIGELKQTVSTFPDPFEGTKSTAEIKIHPSGQFLYNSNRGQPDMVTPEGDAIVAWSIDPAEGTLTLIGHTIDAIGQPWSFDFDTGGANLYAANYTDSTVTQFTVDPVSGALLFTGNSTDIPFPFVIAISA
ncbi:MAG: lactonase family protein [Thermomicrobiales bacterium]|nr:lactonase family protein [Thermomicrobiales bacterium]MCO5223412.1 lactonase family protein [Thermomicrobiales bacterium]